MNSKTVPDTIKEFLLTKDLEWTTSELGKPFTEKPDAKN